MTWNDLPDGFWLAGRRLPGSVVGRFAAALAAVQLVLTGLALPTAWAASCCGGGSASSLILPKISSAMVDVSLDIEKYDGYWNQDGQYQEDPPGSDLRQYRLSLGYGHRLAENWQASVAVPFVMNENRYSGVSSSTRGLGDATAGFWYETFENVMCVWRVQSWEDLIPAVYLGGSLVVPTGISPYDDVESSFDITGRGFYRADGTVLFDKTIYPWNASLLLSYGKYLERPVNREYGRYVEPYAKRLGDRLLATLSFGYTHFLESMNSLTFTLAFSDLREAKGTIDGRTDPTTGMEKKSKALTAAWSTMDRDWVAKATYSFTDKRDGGGSNFAATDILTLGVTHVLR